MRKRNIAIISCILTVVVLTCVMVGCSTQGIELYGNLALNATVEYSTVDNAQFLIDGDSNTIWKADSSEYIQYAVITFGQPVKFDKIILHENGYSILDFEIAISTNSMIDKWSTIYKGKTVNGYQVCTFEAVKATKIKLTITRSQGKFELRDMGVYYDNDGQN